MPMHVRVNVSGLLIEELTLRRLQALSEEREVYTYKCTYTRRAPHRTYTSEPPSTVYIPHTFSDGSLVLIRNAIDELLGQATKRRLP